MLVLLWLIRIYRWWMFAWVLLTWVPGIGNSELFFWLGAPVLPVLQLFSFLTIGNLGFGPIIPLFLLYLADQALSRKLGLLPEQQVEAVVPQEQSSGRQAEEEGMAGGRPGE